MHSRTEIVIENNKKLVNTVIVSIKKGENYT